MSEPSKIGKFIAETFRSVPIPNKAALSFAKLPIETKLAYDNFLQTVKLKKLSDSNSLDNLELYILDLNILLDVIQVF